MPTIQIRGAGPVIELPHRSLEVSGARGESFADIARRVGEVAGVAVPPGATDIEVLALLATSFTEVVAAAGYQPPLDPARVATVANITLSGEQTIDGIAVVSGDRVLVKNQSIGGANGVYVASAGAWTRATDFDQTAEVLQGSYIRVAEGDNASGAWVLVTADPITVGTTAQVWRMFSVDAFERLASTRPGKGAAMVRFEGGKTVQDLASTDDDEGAALMGFKYAGSGAGLETVQEALRRIIYGNGYQVVGDGIVGDSAALINAIAANAGGKVRLSPGTYLLDATLGDIPQETHLVGDSRYGTKVLRGFNGGYMANALERVMLSDMTWDGNGDNFTGGIIDLPVNNHNQSLRNLRLVNAVGDCLHFTATGALLSQCSGSRIDIYHVEALRTDGDPGSGNFAVVHDDPGVVTAGHPNSIVHLETGGMASISFGACNNWYLTNCTLFDCEWSDLSQGIHAAAGRWASTIGYHIKGSGSYDGIGWGSHVIFGADGAFTSSGEYNFGYTDATGANGVLDIRDYTIHDDWEPVWEAGGTPITVGNGFTYFRWCRNGRFIEIDARLEVGSTTTGMDGGLITLAGLPQAVINGFAFQNSFFLDAEYTDVGTPANSFFHQFRGRIAGDAIEFTRDTTGPMADLNPAPLTNEGTIFQATGRYVCG